MTDQFWLVPEQMSSKNKDQSFLVQLEFLPYTLNNLEEIIILIKPNILFVVQILNFEHVKASDI